MLQKVLGFIGLEDFYESLSKNDTTRILLYSNLSNKELITDNNGRKQKKHEKLV
jgi:hypothetical protein